MKFVVSRRVCQMARLVAGGGCICSFTEARLRLDVCTMCKNVSLSLLCKVATHIIVDEPLKAYCEKAL